MVLQLAEALLPGVRVVATSSTEESEAWVRGLGAEATVNHRAGELRGQIAAAIGLAQTVIHVVLAQWIEAGRLIQHPVTGE